jgi:hypothetical protein
MPGIEKAVRAAQFLREAQQLLGEISADPGTLDRVIDFESAQLRIRDALDAMTAKADQPIEPACPPRRHPVLKLVSSR